MLHLKSISGPEVHGRGRYKVENPAPLDFTNGAITDWGLSGRNVLLDGEVVFVHHVAHHVSHGPRTDRTLVLVTKPLRSKRYTPACKYVDDVAFLHKIYDADDGQIDITLDLICDGYPDLPRNLVRAKLYRLIARGYAYGYADDAGRILGYHLTGKGDQLVEKWYGHEVR